MVEGVNRSLFAALSAPPDMSGGALILAWGLANLLVYMGPVLLILLWVLGEAGDRHAAVTAALSALLALAVAATLSASYFHPRPFMDGLSLNYLRHAPDTSFPSDHATLLFAFGWSLLFVRPPTMRLVWILAMCLAVAVGWSRVYLGVHYPFDIIGGAIIALACAAGLCLPWGRRLALALTAFGERVYNWPLAKLSDRGRK